MTAYEKSRDKYLRKNYGITLKQYQSKLKAQGDCCALCGKHKSRFSRALHVDHNHKTGAVRGLLCFYCNRRRVGRLTLETIIPILEYLKKYE